MQFDDPFLAGSDLGFTRDAGTIIHYGLELHVGRSRGKDVSSRGQDLRGALDGLGKVAGDGRERGRKQISETVAFKIAGTAETVLKEPGDKVLIFRYGNQAVANIARRNNIQFAPQPAAGATIVTDGHNGGEIGNVWGTPGRFSK